MKAVVLSVDSDGNKLLRYDKKIVLRLKKNKRDLNIGVLHKTKDGIISYYKNEKDSDVFRKNNSWSINYEVLKLATGTVNYRTKTKIYRITAEKALEVGDFLWFKTSGIAREIYVTLDNGEQEDAI